MRFAMTVASLFALSAIPAGPLLSAEQADDLAPGGALIVRNVDLSGTWSFQLDPQDQGVAEQWFAKPLAKQIRLPGSLQTQGFGDDVAVDTKWVGEIVDRSYFTSPRYEPYRKPGNVKYPCWLQPDKVYAGAAWYQREIEVPAAWKDQHVVLTLERPHWETRVWVGDKAFGSNDSLSTPHVYDLGPLPAGKHRLTVRVDNRMIVNVGPNSHSVSDHTQGNWNGIAGEMTLAYRAPVWIDDVQVYPDAARKTARVVVKVGNETGAPTPGTLVLDLHKMSGTPKLPRASLTKRVLKREPVDIPAGGKSVEIEWRIEGAVTPWDEFDPVLYQLGTELEAADEKRLDSSSAMFGFRDFKPAGTQFALNGRPFYVRGTLDCCIYPLTGYPPCDESGWEKVISAAKAHGLNHIRCHSWCPPEAAFAVADRLGFTFQVEIASWANSGSSVGDGKPVDAWLYKEAERILKAYGNHPSFVMMAYGNEPAGGKQKQWLGEWVNHWKKTDPRRVYTSGAGWPEIPENQYHNIPGPRIQGWGEGLKSRINGRPPETRTDYASWVQKRNVPIVSHEIGQWCVYPNFDEMKKYTGHLKPKNFEIFRDFLAASHMADQAHDFLIASGKLQTLCYKEEIESSLRTPGFGGFQLLDLHDFPGQGTALVGVLDPFWESKGYVTPEQFRRFCNSTVPLARMEKRYWKASETFKADIDIAHFGAAPIENAAAAWKVVDEAGKVLASGKLPAKTVPVGNGTSLGTVEVPLANAAPAKRHALVVGIEGTPFENDWDVWVFADAVEAAPPADVLIAESLDEAALARLKAGGKVLLLAPPATVKSSVAIGFSSVFWNTAWTHNQPPHTLGILCDPKHPAFAAFPAEGWSNWQWWELVTGSAAMILNDLPAELRPLVQPIDTWFEARRLGLLVEAKVGGGKLMVCSMNLAKDLDRRIVARQMRRSVLDYMAGASFAPKVALAPEQVAALFKAGGGGASGKAKADSEAPGFEAANAVDGNPETLWHTAWEPTPAPMPHHLVIDLGKERPVKGIVYTPRQDMENGRIAAYEVYVSKDGASWGEAVASGTWPGGPAKRTVNIKSPVPARYVKLVAKSEVKGNAFAAVAELEVD
jgi:hypothetical protein